MCACVFCESANWYFGMWRDHGVPGDSFYEVRPECTDVPKSRFKIKVCVFFLYLRISVLIGIHFHLESQILVNETDLTEYWICLDHTMVYIENFVDYLNEKWRSFSIRMIKV